MSGALRRVGALFGFARRPRTAEQFEQTFRHFREVLDGNKRALEIITEMGDVLGGDYLFDVEYVKRARAELSVSVERSLRAFEELDGERHRALRRVASSIDAMIARIVDETPSRDLVLFHEEITPDRAEAAGGKAANVALVRNAAKLPVPDGFVITTWAFDCFLRHNQLRDAAPPSARHPSLMEAITFAEEGESDTARSIASEVFPGGAPASRPREGDGAERGGAPPAARDPAELALHGEIPAELGRELDRALAKLRGRCGRGATLAVRSSAEAEDGAHSFAGQFETVLNVPLDRGAVEAAYRRVVASLFSPKAIAYQERFGYAPGATKMAVACMAMVDAAVSGVLYTSNPVGASDTMVIDAAWGLGTSIVDGRVDPDHLVVKKDGTGAVVEARVGEKAAMAVPRPGGGTREVETPGERRREPCLAPDAIARLVDAGLALERHFRAPQDVEWALDGAGRLFVLQCRPLRVSEAAARPEVDPGAARPIALRARGIVVQEGAAAGKVHLLENLREVDSVPRGAILVTRHDSANLVRAMPHVSAILTDVGAATSHMASLSREFRLPTIVNTGDATRVLAEGQEVTVIAARDAPAVYPGRIARALAPVPDQALRIEELREFRRRRYVLRLVAPLNLVDPLRDDFTPEGCRTIHDVLRFVHEKAVTRLIECADFGARSRRAVALDLSVPAGIGVIDIGGGLERLDGTGRARLEQLASVPFRALAVGLTTPGVWRSEAVPIRTGDFLSSMFRAPDVLAQGAFAERNVAVISREYANVHIKFGYHYTIVDCYCSDTPRDNHVDFRFAGGATDLTQRSLRLQLLSTVLEKHGFNARVRGDLLAARLANVGRDEMIPILEEVGRLLAFSRQLDAVLRNEEDVQRFATSFLAGRYEVQ